MVPKLSIVAVTRNDNHGGDLDKRMQLFIDGLFEQSEKFRFFIEIVLVEWNPPEDRPPLEKCLDWSKQSDFAKVKIIEVPPDIHMKYKYSDKLPLFQMIGKNVGIRRASGEYILATNIDILLSDELFEYLATVELQDDKMYRADRFDVDNNLPVGASTFETLLYCEKNIIRKNKITFTENMITEKKYSVYSNWDMAVCERNNMPCIIHTNACGDFQLLSKNTWHLLHGYPEFAICSMHIDSILSYMAMLRDISETIISDEHPNAVSYHIEHDSGFRCEDDEPIEVRFMRKGIFCLSNPQLFATVLRMVKDEKQIIANSDAWGMKYLQLKETAIENGVSHRLKKRGNEEFDPQRICNTDEWIQFLREEEKVYKIDYSALYTNLRKKICKRYLGFYYNATDAQIEKIYKKLIDGEADIIAYGASAHYRRYILPGLSDSTIKIKYIVDNDKDKVGKDVDGVPIYGREILQKENRDNIYIFITSFLYEEIKKELIDMGFEELENFIKPYKENAIKEEFMISYFEKFCRKERL